MPLATRTGSAAHPLAAALLAHSQLFEGETNWSYVFFGILLAARGFLASLTLSSQHDCEKSHEDHQHAMNMQQVSSEL